MRYQHARSWVRRSLSVTVVATLLAIAGPARASAGDWDFIKPADLNKCYAVLGALLGGSAAATVATSGLVIGIRNGISAAQGQQPTVGMIQGGFILNLISIAASTAWMIAWKESNALRFGVGVPLAAVGAAGLGLTIWAATRSEKPQKVTLSLVPQLAVDRAGGLAYGAGLRVAGF